MRGLSRWHYRVGVAIPSLAILLLLAGMVRGSLASKKASMRLEVQNLTQSLQVLSVESTGDGQFNLVMRNNSDKVILDYAYSFSPSNGLNATLKSIAPGETRVEEVGGAGSPRRRTLTLLAILFEDLSGEGDPSVIQYFQGSFYGSRAFIKQFATLLERLPEVSQEVLPQVTSTLKDQVEALRYPVEEQGMADRSMGFKAGYRSSKDSVLYDIEQIFGPRQGLVRPGRDSRWDPLVKYREFRSFYAEAEKRVQAATTRSN